MKPVVTPQNNVLTCPHCHQSHIRPAWPFEHRQAVTIAIYEEAHPGKSVLPLHCDHCGVNIGEVIVSQEAKARLLHGLGRAA